MNKYSKDISFRQLYSSLLLVVHRMGRLEQKVYENAPGGPTLGPPGAVRAIQVFTWSTYPLLRSSQQSARGL